VTRIGGAWSCVVHGKPILEMETTQAKDVGIKGRSSLKVAALITNFGAKFLLLFVRLFLQQLHESVQPPLVIFSEEYLSWIILVKILLCKVSTSSKKDTYQV
jgi:hypothetical protein